MKKTPTGAVSVPQCERTYVRSKGNSVLPFFFLNHLSELLFAKPTQWQTYDVMLHSWMLDAKDKVCVCVCLDAGCSVVSRLRTTPRGALDRGEFLLFPDNTLQGGSGSSSKTLIYKQNRTMKVYHYSPSTTLLHPDAQIVSTFHFRQQSITKKGDPKI